MGQSATSHIHAKSVQGYSPNTQNTFSVWLDSICHLMVPITNCDKITNCGSSVFWLVAICDYHNLWGFKTQLLRLMTKVTKRYSQMQNMAISLMCTAAQWGWLCLSLGMVGLLQFYGMQIRSGVLWNLLLLLRLWLCNKGLSVWIRRGCLSIFRKCCLRSVFMFPFMPLCWLSKSRRGFAFDQIGWWQKTENWHWCT